MPKKSKNFDNDKVIKAIEHIANIAIVELIPLTDPARPPNSKVAKSSLDTALFRILVIAGIYNGDRQFKGFWYWLEHFLAPESTDIGYPKGIFKQVSPKNLTMLKDTGCNVEKLVESMNSKNLDKPTVKDVREYLCLLQKPHITRIMVQGKSTK